MNIFFYSILTTVLTVPLFVFSSIADPGDLFVVVDLNDETACSILKVNPEGSLSEFLSDTEIRAATLEPQADCDNVGIACALNGDIYFSEDFSENGEQSRILKGGPSAGDVSLFTSNSAIIAATGDDGSNLEKGMTFGPDGNLYTADEFTNSILQVTVPGSNVSVTVTEMQIADVTTEVRLEGGIAIDPEFNIYITESESDSIVSCRPGGPCSLFASDDQIEAAIGFEPNLDEQMILVGNLLYVADDTDCNCIFTVDINTGDIQLFLSEGQMEAVLNGQDAEPEGGLAVDAEGRIYIGNDDDNNQPSILRTGPDANASLLSLFVTPSEVQAIYGDNFDLIEFDAGMCITPGDLPVSQIPTMSEWGMLAMAGVLGVIGLLFAMRRRAVSA